MDRIEPQPPDVAELLRRAEELAMRVSDGHLTIMRFTTEWKVLLGTPVIPLEHRPEIYRLPSSGSLRGALEQLLADGGTARGSTHR